MFSDYKTQIDQILKNTEKEEANNSQDKIAAIAMYRIMIGAISKFIEKGSCSNPNFDAALSLEWKSAGRMLKYIWSKAEKLALRHGHAASCCLTEEVVYAWVHEYYFLDDREAVMEERAKRAASEQKQKEAKAKEAQYRKNALDILSKQRGWDDLPDEEKKKKLTSKIKSLKKRNPINLQNQLQRRLLPIADPLKTILFPWKFVKKWTWCQVNRRITVLRQLLQETLLSWK